MHNLQLAVMRRAVLLVVAAFFCQIFARSFYVSVHGNDKHTGSVDAPWKSLSQAADTAAAGDTVYLREGVYRQRLEPHKAGTAQASVVFASFPGEKAVLDGAELSVPPAGGLIDIRGVNNIEIRGITVQNSDGTGIWIMDCSNVLLYGNHTYNTYSSGIMVSEFSSRNISVVIDSNDVELACNDGAQECISVSKCSSFAVINNHVHDGGPGTRGGEGIDIKYGSTDGIVAYNHVHHLSRQGLYADAWSLPTRSVRFYGNVVHDCQFGIGAASERGGTLSDIVFHNNIVYDCPGPGLYILVAVGPLENVFFVNNTVHNTGAQWGLGLYVNWADNARGILVRNNIFSAMDTATVLIVNGSPQIQMENNITDAAVPGNAQWYDEAVIEYRDPVKGDFSLLAGSPAIDAGSADVPFDLTLGDAFSMPRVQDGDDDGVSRIDIGALEYQPTAAVARVPRGFAGNTKSNARQLLLWKHTPLRSALTSLISLDGRSLPGGSGMCRAAGVVVRIPQVCSSSEEFSISPSRRRARRAPSTSPSTCLESLK